MDIDELMLKFRKYVEGYSPEELYGDKLIALFQEFIKQENAQQSEQSNSEYVLYEDNDEMYGTGPHRLQRSRRR